MSIYQCPKGHASTEPDYCSECGVKIQGVPEIALTVNTFSETVETRNLSQCVGRLCRLEATGVASLQPTITCPDCTAPHDPNSGDFCEICGYNFLSGAHGEVPPVATDVATDVTDNLTVRLTDQPSATSATSSVAEIIATIDPSLQSPESPEPPNQPPITFRLDKESHLIGRRSQPRGVYPEVALDFDSAVSHRHALLNRLSDGTFVLRDIGSTNGTYLNGVELTPMVDVPIKDGDEVTLGHWTRIKVRLIRNS